MAKSDHGSYQRGLKPRKRRQQSAQKPDMRQDPTSSSATPTVCLPFTLIKTERMDMQIGDAVRFRIDAPHRDTLGPMADEIGIVVDVAEVDGVETLVVKFGDNGPLEAGVPASEFEPATVI